MQDVRRMWVACERRARVRAEDESAGGTNRPEGAVRAGTVAPYPIEWHNARI